MAKHKRKKTGIIPARTKTYPTFLAIELPLDLREQLVEVQQQLRQTLNLPQRNLKFELADKLHITLIYFGRLSRAEQQSVASLVASEIQALPIKQLRLADMGYFYNRHTDSIIMVEVAESDWLVKLHRGLVRRLRRELGMSLSDKKLRPHVTLARLKRVTKQQKQQILSQSLQVSGPPQGVFDCWDLSLLQSSYNSRLDTSEYQLLRRMEFGQAS